MKEKFSNSEILEAINFFLEEKSNVTNNKKKKYDELPKDTEKIILQAEKYLKKN